MSLYIFYSFSLFLAFLYVSIIFYVIHQWNKSLSQPHSLQSEPKTGFSIVIIARNEENNIGHCIQSILDNDYPKNLFEIIVVDDHSEDDTIKVVQAFAQCKVLELKDHLKGQATNAFKKEGIQFAVDHAAHDIIVCTDADTITNKHWLKSIAKNFENENLDFLTGPIIFNPLKNTFSHFENLDIMGMMGVTAAGIQSKLWYMANGANMAFRKKIFIQLDPYSDSKNHASGDDIFLINAFHQANKKVHFNTEHAGVVLTPPTASFSAFYKQRIRWATKNKSSKSLAYLFVMAVPFLFSWALILNVLLLVITGGSSFMFLLFLFILKLCVDYFYLNKLAVFFDQKPSIKRFLPSAILHVLYIAVIGLLSLFVRKYSWKGRQLH